MSIARQILNPWTTREVYGFQLLMKELSLRPEKRWQNQDSETGLPGPQHLLHGFQEQMCVNACQPARCQHPSVGASVDAHGWGPVPPSSLGTGTKGSQKGRQDGSVGARVSESVGKNSGNPLAQGRSFEW